MISDYKSEWEKHRDSEPTMILSKKEIEQLKEISRPLHLDGWNDRSLVERLTEIKRHKSRRLDLDQLELRKQILEYENEKEQIDIWDELVESVNKTTLNKKDK